MIRLARRSTRLRNSHRKNISTQTHVRIHLHHHYHSSLFCIDPLSLGTAQFACDIDECTLRLVVSVKYRFLRGSFYGFGFGTSDVRFISFLFETFFFLHINSFQLTSNHFNAFPLIPNHFLYSFSLISAHFKSFPVNS